MLGVALRMPCCLFPMRLTVLFLRRKAILSCRNLRKAMLLLYDYVKSYDSEDLKHSKMNCNEMKRKHFLRIPFNRVRVVNLKLVFEDCFFNY